LHLAFKVQLKHLSTYIVQIQINGKAYKLDFMASASIILGLMKLNMQFLSFKFLLFTAASYAFAEGCQRVFIKFEPHT